MEKLTKKQLQGLAKDLHAFYCGSNVYNHENITYYIQHDYKKLNDYPGQSNYEIMEHIGEATKDKDNYIIYAKQIAYSCGMYGNTGQLVQYEINTTKGVIDTFYTYYC